MTLCTADFIICTLYHGFMKADLRISSKDYRHNKNLKVTVGRLFRRNN